MNHECGMEKKIQCKLCYKKFRRKWNLEQHQKRIHRKQYKLDQLAAIKAGHVQDENDEAETQTFWELDFRMLPCEEYVNRCRLTH